MIEVSQVGRQEMPATIKTLQKALEMVRVRVNVVGGSGVSLVSSEHNDYGYTLGDSFYRFDE
jgi:hypothetical protein